MKRDNLALISNYIKEQSLVGCFPQLALTIYSYLRYSRKVKHSDRSYWEREAQQFVERKKLA